MDALRWGRRVLIPRRVEIARGIVCKTAASLHQSNFRGRNDDGSETAATWKATAGTNWTQAVDESFRIRFLVQDAASGGENNVRFQLQRNLNGAGWAVVDGTTAVVRTFDSTHFADDDDTTQQIGSGPFITPNQCMDDLDGIAGAGNLVDFIEGTADEVEVEYCVQIIGADVNDADTIEFRLVRSNLAVLEDYTGGIPTVTVSEVAGAQDLQGASVSDAFTAATGELDVEVLDDFPLPFRRRSQHLYFQV